jgi:mRNA-degrading endonuclease RelE of RelBE toxin-antitoxin system
MADYALIFARSARKDLESLDPPVGSVNLWRVRVGDWRVIYSIDDQRRIVDIGAVRHRGDAYR